MINVRQAGQKDQIIWDNYVLSNTCSSPYHLWAWKLSVEQAYKHKSIYLIAENNEKIAGVFPLFNLRLPGLINELTALPYCDVGNCIADSVSGQNKLLNQGRGIASQMGCRKSSLRGSVKYIEGPQKYLELEKSVKVRMCLSLPGSSEELWAGFKSKLRSQIRKAERNGVKFCWKGVDGVDDFYTIYSRNMSRLGSPPHSKKWFHAIMSNYGSRGRIGLATFEGRPVGAGLILSTNTVTAIPWASTLFEFNNLSPNMLLYWNFLKYSADKGFKAFDFGRSTEGEGTYNFKKQWGAEAQPLEWFTFLISNDCKEKTPEMTRASSRELVELLWKKLPLAASNFLGSRIRKFISL